MTETSDVAKKRKNDTEDEVVAKKRKVEVDNGNDSDDICIISNDALHDNTSELKKSTLRNRKLSDDIDCIIVCDDDND